MDHAASYRPNDAPRNLGLVDISSIEKLHLSESLAQLFVSMSKSERASITAGEKSVLVSAQHCMYWAALDLFNHLFGLEQVYVTSCFII